MTDKVKEQGDKLQNPPEVKPLGSSDAQAIAAPTAQDKQAAEADRTNQSSGSLTELALKSRGMTREQVAQQLAAQGDSVSIDYGNGLEVSRKTGLTGRDIEKRAQQAQSQMDTATVLAAEAKTNPAAEPVKLLKEWVEKQPESPQKEAFRQEVRQQAADLSPEMKARMEHLEAVRRKIDAAGLEAGGVHEAVTPEKAREHLAGRVEQQENPWQAFNRLTPEQQRGIVKAFEQGGAVGKEAYEQKIEAVSESIPKGFYNVGKGLLDTGVAAATFVLESVKEPEKVPKAASELVEHLSAAITNGVELSTFAAGQAHDMAKTGDYSPAIRAIGFVVETANERWEAMPLETRTEKGSELIAEMGIGSIIGAWHNLAKSGKLIDALEEIAEHLKDLTAPGREKAKQAIGKLLGDVLQPKGLTTQGIEMPIPRDIDELAMLRNKGLPDNVKPSERLTTRRERDLDGAAAHKLDVPKQVYEAAEKRGISRQVVDEKLDKVAQSLTEAYNILGEYSPRKHGSERAYGSQLHELLRRQLGTDDLLHTEASYRKGLPVPWGRLGSSRVDIAIGPHEKPFTTMCLKTLGAVPSAQQERGWFSNLPRFDDDSVIPRIYFKLGN